MKLHSKIREPKASLGDPLQLLPSELWLKIIREYISDDPDGILTLCLISTSWRDATISTAILWTNVVVRDSHDRICISHLHQILSRDLHLSVTFIFPLSLKTFEFHIDLINQESHRIKELLFDSSFLLSDQEFIPGDKFVAYYMVRQVLRRVNQLPLLEKLIITLGRYHGEFRLPPCEDIPQSIRIHTFSGLVVVTNDFHYFHLQSLRSIELYSTLSELYPLLSKMKSLKELSLLGPPVDREEDLSTKITEFDMPQLETLSFYQPAVQALFPLLAAQGRLTSLTVTVQWNSLQALCNHLTFTPSLENLVIELDDSDEEFQRPTIIPSNLSFLRRLWIIHKVNNYRRHSLCRPMGTLLEAVPLLSSGIQELKIDSRSIEIPIKSLSVPLSRLSLLKSLTLEINTPHLETAPCSLPVFLPALQRLRLLGSSNILSYIDAPCLHTLEYRNYTYKPPSFVPSSSRLQRISLSADLASQLQSMTLSHLHTIEWLTDSPECAEASLSFPSLKTIKFGPGETTVNTFCELLVRFPSRASILENIYFRDYPSWTMLFLMLHRRNSLSKGTVSGIKSIHLPAYPGPSILEPLTKLLRGEQELPNERHLFFNVVEIMTDPELAGCTRCILSGRNCRFLPMEASDSVYYPIPFDPKVGDSKGWELPLPSFRIQAWVEDWPRARHELDEKVGKFTENWDRLLQCSAHDSGEVAITGYTLHEVPFEAHELQYLDTLYA